MSQPRDPDPVKLIASIFSPQEPLIQEVISKLCLQYGPVDWVSPPMFFDRTRYYEREMGWPLHRRFVSFEQLIRPEDLVQIKLNTNEIERQYLEGENRQVNIDPGYIGLERLILATGKNYVHRVYLSHGIYADLTLIFKKGSFRPLEWTYKDYANPEMISMFNNLRKRYMDQLRQRRKVEQEQ